jgi:alkylation response protein AidB-like acyl-CoA dehydrogenase
MNALATPALTPLSAGLPYPCAPSAEELRERARSLAPEMRQRAAETERLRRLPAANVAALRQAGLFRLLQARRSAGWQASLRTHIDVVAEVARGCASTAWCLAVVQAHTWLLSLFPEAAQDDVYAGNPDALASAVILARAQARRVNDGFAITGAWPFCSGCHHADWVLLGAAVADQTGAVVDEGMLLLPAAEVEVRDDWHVMGLCGTGSCTVAVKDRFVPAHRYLSFAALARGQAPVRDLHDGWL